MFSLEYIDLRRVKNGWIVKAEFRTSLKREYAGCREWAKHTIPDTINRVNWIMTAQWDDLDFPTMADDEAGAATPSVQQ